MRLLLDTNVLVAAFLSRGVCHELVEHRALNHEVVASEHVLEELLRTLMRKGKVPPQRAEEALALLRARFTLAPSPLLEAPASRDADDDLVLSAAQQGGCACVVTGDAHLLELGSWNGIDILTPTGFWRYEADRR